MCIQPLTNVYHNNRNQLNNKKCSLNPTPLPSIHHHHVLPTLIAARHSSIKSIKHKRGACITATVRKMSWGLLCHTRLFTCIIPFTLTTSNITYFGYGKITRENDAQRGCVTCPKSHSWDMAGPGIKDNLCTAEVEFLPLHRCLFPSRKMQNSRQGQHSLLITFIWVSSRNPQWWASRQTSSKYVRASGSQTDKWDRWLTDLATPYVLIMDQLQNASSGLGLGSHK